MVIFCPNTGAQCTTCTAPCRPTPKPMPGLPPHQLGWQCPKCGQGNAPWNAVCPCGPTYTFTITGGTIPKQR